MMPTTVTKTTTTTTERFVMAQLISCATNEMVKKCSFCKISKQVIILSFNCHHYNINTEFHGINLLLPVERTIAILEHVFQTLSKSWDIKTVNEEIQGIIKNCNSILKLLQRKNRNDLHFLLIRPKV